MTRRNLSAKIDRGRSCTGRQIAIATKLAFAAPLTMGRSALLGAMEAYIRAKKRSWYFMRLLFRRMKSTGWSPTERQLMWINDHLEAEGGRRISCACHSPDGKAVRYHSRKQRQAVEALDEMLSRPMPRPPPTKVE